MSSDVQAGQTVFVVDEVGGTFAFPTPESAQEFYESERGSYPGPLDELTTFRTQIPRDMTWDEAADYACSHGADAERSPL